MAPLPPTQIETMNSNSTDNLSAEDGGVIVNRAVRRSASSFEECEAFEAGKPSGTCIGDGHYRCQECKLLRPDFTGQGGFEAREAYLDGLGGTSGLRVYAYCVAP